MGSVAPHTHPPILGMLQCLSLSLPLSLSLIYVVCLHARVTHAPGAFDVCLIFRRVWQNYVEQAHTSPYFYSPNLAVTLFVSIKKYTLLHGLLLTL